MVEVYRVLDPVFDGKGPCMGPVLVVVAHVDVEDTRVAAALGNVGAFFVGPSADRESVQFLGCAHVDGDPMRRTGFGAAPLRAPIGVVLAVDDRNGPPAVGIGGRRLGLFGREARDRPAALVICRERVFGVVAVDAQVGGLQRFVDRQAGRHAFDADGQQEDAHAVESPAVDGDPYGRGDVFPVGNHRFEVFDRIASVEHHRIAALVLFVVGRDQFGRDPEFDRHVAARIADAAQVGIDHERRVAFEREDKGVLGSVISGVDRVDTRIVLGVVHVQVILNRVFAGGEKRSAAEESQVFGKFHDCYSF